MVWVRIDDRMPDNPKVAAAGPLALAMQVAALCYCNRELTDGFVPRSVARRLLDWHAEDAEGRLWKMGRTSGMVGDDVDSEWVIGLLLDAGMWKETAGGYAIHDFGDYQPSRAEVEDLAAKRSEAGRRGGLAKAKAVAKQVPGKGSSKSVAKSYPEPVPVPREQSPSSTDVDTDDLLRGFDEFWGVWPKRGGRKVGKDKAQERWRKLTLDERRAAFRAARNYAKASDEGHQGAMDAWRWLRDRLWVDFIDDAAPDARRNLRDRPVTLLNGEEFGI